AHTLHVGRKHFPYRLVASASSALGAAAELRNRSRGPWSGAPVVKPRRVAFWFTGQGSQYAGMARDLLAHEPDFAEPFERCMELLASLGCDMRPDIHPARESTTSRLDQTAFAQPAIFAL